MSDHPGEIRVYEPDQAIKKGYLSMLGEIFQELSANRWLIYQLFLRDFSSVYKQSLFGFIWPILIPILSVGTFMIMNRSGVLDIGTMDLPYPLFAILGLSVWQIFARGITAGANSLVKAGPMITRINFSRKCLVIAAFGQVLIFFCIEFLLCLVLFVAYGLTPTPYIILFPVLVLPMLWLTVGLGLILAVINGIIRDIAHILTVGVTFLMFLTPILYQKPGTGLLARLTEYNPFYYLTAFPRDLILQGKGLLWAGYTIVGCLSLVFFLFCLVVFHLTESRVAERI